MINNLGRKMIIGFGLGLAVLLGLILYADIRQVTQLLQNFQWRLLPADSLFYALVWGRPGCCNRTDLA